ncbi:MAG: hypothetical protein U1G07_12230 [Verrucomicrobiota bacterium]
MSSGRFLVWSGLALDETRQSGFKRNGFLFAQAFTFSLAAALLGMSLPVLAATPSNDNLSNAALLAGESVIVTGSNVGASKEVGEPNHAGNQGGRSIWWRWTAPRAGSVVVTTVGSSFDTLLGAYNGTSFLNLNLIVNNDDSGHDTASKVAFNIASGTTYLFAVDGFGGASGSIQFSLRVHPESITQPENDDFANRRLLVGTTVETAGANRLATKEAQEPNHAGELGGASVWWSWTAPLGGDVTIDTKGSDFDTILGVYTGSVLTNLVLVARNDDAATNLATSRVTFAALPETTYQIAVDGFGGDSGAIQLQLEMDGLIWLQPLRILPLGGYQLSLTGPARRQYVLEATTNLVDWLQVESRLNSNGTVQFADPAATGLPKRFYRARVVP